MPRNDDHSTGDARQPYSEQGGPEGRHAQTHDVRREKATRSKPHNQDQDEFADDLVADRSRLAGDDDTVPASDDKRLQADMPQLGADELSRLSILKPGTRLDQGSVYVDLNDLERGPFKALGSQEATGHTRYVAKRETDYEMWDQLVGQGRTAAVERPDDHD